MKTGFDFLIKTSKYNEDVLQDFEKVLGKLPKDYKEIILNYKTGYPSLETIGDKEVYARIEDTNDTFIIESLITLPEVMDKLHGLDRAYGISGNHRKYQLIPFCTSGSSYREYYIKLDTGEIFFLNPNMDMDRELSIENNKLANNANEFIKSFAYENQ